MVRGLGHQADGWCTAIGQNVAPRRFHEHQQRREQSLRTRRLAGSDLPLYGLPATWAGARQAWIGTGIQSVRLVGPLGLWSRRGPFVAFTVHASHLGTDGTRLVVETRRRPDSDPDPWPARAREGEVDNFLRHVVSSPGPDYRLAGPPEDFEERVQAHHRALASGELSWASFTVSVDGKATTFERLSVGSHWLAVGHLDDEDLALEGCTFDPALIALVRIPDAAAWAVTAT
ncbi:MAG: hypothetical protein ACRDYD_09630 [Acidimicrobiales bacterium]